MRLSTKEKLELFKIVRDSQEDGEEGLRQLDEAEGERKNLTVMLRTLSQVAKESLEMELKELATQSQVEWYCWCAMVLMAAQLGFWLSSRFEDIPLVRREVRSIGL